MFFALFLVCAFMCNILYIMLPHRNEGLDDLEHILSLDDFLRFAAVLRRERKEQELGDNPVVDKLQLLLACMHR